MSPSLSRLPQATKLFLGAALIAGSGAYYIGNAYAEDDTAAAPPAPIVEVIALAPSDIRGWSHFSGRLSPVASADIKPLVSGTIQQVLFVDGQWVKKGDPLFVIDPRPHQAALQRAEAQLATAKSRAKLARTELDRARQLVESKLVSQSLFDAANSNHQVAVAAVLEAESGLNQARLNVEYAHISAPIDGRIGRAELTLGNVVEAGANAPILTSIVADNELYAEFNVNEQTYIQLTRSETKPQSMPVEVTLAQDDSVVYRGHIHSFDNHLDTASGTIRARAIFANTDGALIAGMYANIRLGSALTKPTLLIPERAIGTNQSKKFVYVIDSNNTVNYREIMLGDHHQGLRVVLDGVTTGERIVVNGLSHIRPSMVITPVDAPASAQLAAN